MWSTSAVAVVVARPQGAGEWKADGLHWLHGLSVLGAWSGGSTAADWAALWWRLSACGVRWEWRCRSREVRGAVLRLADAAAQAARRARPL